ncbi:hypothetical protein Tco_0700897 [Tanacetum coccineum]
MEEKEVVWSCAGNKSPGPDGFNFNFIKAHWDTLKSAFFKCIHYFEATGRLAKGCNPTFILLIPKKNDPLGFSDFRPISLRLWLQDYLQDLSFEAGEGVSIIDGGSNLSLLQYADDALFFGKWSDLNAKNRIHIPKCFEDASRLKVNLAKSRLFGIGVPQNEVDLIASTINCFRPGCLFGRLIAFLLEDASRSLSFKEDAKDISWAKWENILSSQDKCELGVGSLLAKNLSLPGKWKWRFLNEEEDLWRKVIKSFYGDDGGFDCFLSSSTSNGVWADIVKAVKKIELIDPAFKPSWVVSNGVWSGTWSWSVPPRRRTLDDLSNLINLIRNVSLSGDADDKWVLTLHSSGALNIKALSSMIQDKVLINCNLVALRYVASGNVGNASSFGIPKLSKILHGVYQVEVRSLWGWRNRVCNSSPDSLDAIIAKDTFPSIQRLSLLWISKRCSLKSAIWSVWFVLVPVVSVIISFALS